MAKTKLVPVSTPICVISMLAALQVRAAAAKQVKAPGSALSACVRPSRLWVTAPPQLACGSAAACWLSRHPVSPPAAAAITAPAMMIADGAVPDAHAEAAAG
jgi:hypothetical protein